MPRAFSAWAKEKVSNTLPKCFLVDNTDLKSSSSGLRYRKSPSFGETSKSKPASVVRWNSLVYGDLDVDGNWLKLQDGQYLPVYSSNGIRVLQPIKAAEETSPVATVTTVTVGCLQVPSHLERQGIDADALIDAGPGAFYQVVAERVALRSGPSLGAPVLGQVPRGGEVELFGWDETRQWRRCVDHRLSRSGWILLDHPELGPMVRPLGEKLCVRPLNVIAVAAAEGRLQDLETFLKNSEELDFWDPRGSALVLAAERGQISSCLRLLHAGATATEADLAMARIAKAEIVTLCQLRPEELEELMNISKVGEDEMQQILRRKHRERISVGDADEDVKANSKASNLYEVCYSSVWIRREPHVEAAQVSKRIKGQQLNIEEFDESGEWGRVVFKTSEGMDEGWMLITHPELGALLRPVEDTESVRPAG